MTDIIIILIVCAVLLFALSGAKKRLKGGCCSSGSTKKIKPKAKGDFPFEARAEIIGMSCTNCSLRLENAFNSMPDLSASVSLKKAQAVIKCKREITRDEIEEIIKKCGFEAGNILILK